MSAHENLEHAEHAEHASHGGNKKIALLISVLALFLAFSETLGKSAQTAAITDNVTANDLWAFFQAKTHPQDHSEHGGRAVADRGRSRHRSRRQSAACQDHRGLEDDTANAMTTNRKAAKAASSSWPSAQEAEHKRELAMARYHNYEFASAAFQIGIVLASAQVITSMVVLGWLSGLLGVAGLALTRPRPVGAARPGFLDPHRGTLTGADSGAVTPRGGRRSVAASSAGAGSARRAAASTARPIAARVRAPAR